MINWKVRVKNKMFWLSLIPAALVLIQNVAGCFGIEISINEISDNILSVINSLFVVLSIVGIVTDPTTDGLCDSERAMQYDKPEH